MSLWQPTHLNGFAGVKFAIGADCRWEHAEDGMCWWIYEHVDWVTMVSRIHLKA